MKKLREWWYVMGIFHTMKKRENVHCLQHMSFRMQLLLVFCRDSRSGDQQLVSM